MRDPHALIDRRPPPTRDFQQVFTRVSTPLLVVDRNLRIVYANAAYLRTTGSRLSAIQGHDMVDVFPMDPERVAVIKSGFARALAGKDNVVDAAPFRFSEADGTHRDGIWTCNPHLDPRQPGRRQRRPRLPTRRPVLSDARPPRHRRLTPFAMKSGQNRSIAPIS